LDVIDICGTLHSTTAEYTFFSSPCDTFKKVFHILGHKTHLNKCKQTEIKQNIFIDYSGTKSIINN
jgi:hypothetical protein